MSNIETPGVPIGTITIKYFIAEDGDAQFIYDCEPELDVITQVGLLEMAKDSVLRPFDEEDER